MQQRVAAAYSLSHTKNCPPRQITTATTAGRLSELPVSDPLPNSRVILFKLVAYPALGDPLDVEDRQPAKRIKLLSTPGFDNNRDAKVYSQQQERHPPPLPQQQRKQHPSYSCHQRQQQFSHYPLEHASPSSPADIATAGLDTTDGSPRKNLWPDTTVFDQSWKWPPLASHLLPLSSHLHPDVSRDNLEPRQVFLPPQHPPASGAPRMEGTPLSTSSAIPSTSQCAFSPTSPSDSFYSSQPTQFGTSFVPPIPRPLVLSDGPSTFGPSFKDHSLQPELFSNDGKLHSPFRDCINTFGLYTSEPLRLPVDGQVNGYIKLSYSRGKQGASTSRAASISYGRVVELDESMKIADDSASQSPTSIIGPPRGPSTPTHSPMEFIYDYSSLFSQSSNGNSMLHTPTGLTPSPVPSNASAEVAYMGAPKLLPSQYGCEAKMDDTDRRFWMFYIRNWCPGRSVLEDTNLWLKDFAQMQKSIGVRSAIQSLAGIYIYDYLPLESIRLRVNQRFFDAEERFSQLLQDPTTATDEGQANELITIAVILSMQDIVLTERRLKKPFAPRWLQGFRQGEQFLQLTDHGSRFWKTTNVQSSSLRTSQSIIVGRAVILAQPMCSLPPPNKFDAQKEAARFGWLLYGTEKYMFQIHGGCGFSKKLLHVLSQVTYCAARLLQEAESPTVPMTADYLYKELLKMRQWSSESNSWDAVKSGSPVIDWVRSQPEDYRIDSNSNMTDATAEAWRFAAILYLQCRVLRLPRNHPEVISKLDDLARCIEIMPTSGTHFTAQAPLFPVFLLGVLATVPKHKVVSSKWFDEVLQTPVRSSVPPLHTALVHIWSWIDTEVPESMLQKVEIPKAIHKREPWWEKLVIKVLQQEQEVLCLT